MTGEMRISADTLFDWYKRAREGYYKDGPLAKDIYEHYLRAVREEAEGRGSIDHLPASVQAFIVQAAQAHHEHVEEMMRQAFLSVPEVPTPEEVERLAESAGFVMCSQCKKPYRDHVFARGTIECPVEPSGTSA